MNVLAVLFKLLNLTQNIYYKSYNYLLKGYLISRGAIIGENVKFGRRTRVVLGENCKLVIEDNTEISDDSWVIVHDNSELVIQNNCFISHHCILSSNSKVFIGKFTAVGPYCIILDTNKKFDNPKLFIREQGYESAPIHIEEDVWLGAFSVVLKGVEIGRHSVIAANTVVTKNIQTNTLNGGSPSKKIIDIKENYI